LRSPKQWLRPLNLADLPAVLETEAACYPQPWSHNTFAECVEARSKGYHCVALMLDESLAGHCVFTVIIDEAELLNFCLAPAHQGQGLAKPFLDQVLADMAGQGAATIFLEVRESNEAALRLYVAVGFNEIGRRKGYYSAPQGREDAILMSREL
jgi:ribosomal-protein-alanine N-acetyltransferase